MDINDIPEVLENKYEILFKKMLNGFSLHKIKLDDNGKPTDYEFIEVNESFEKMTGLKGEDIIGKNVTEVIPGIKDDKANWIEKYGKIAIYGGEERFEDFSVPLDKWFSIYVFSPTPGYFATIFDDITDRKKIEISLHEKIEELEKINKIMVQRELDMIKLKEKINEIEEDNSKES